MQKKLVKYGNSHAVVIDKPILNMLHIDENTPLSINTDGDVLIIAPQRSKKRQKQIDDMARKIASKYSSTFKKLAE